MPPAFRSGDKTASLHELARSACCEPVLVPGRCLWLLDFMKQTLEFSHRGFRGASSPSITNQIDPDEADRVEIDAILSFIEAREAVFQALAANANAEAGRPVTGIFFTPRMRALEDGQRLGTVRPGIRTDIAAHADIGMMSSPLCWWLGEGRDTFIDQLRRPPRTGTAVVSIIRPISAPPPPA